LNIQKKSDEKKSATVHLGTEDYLRVLILFFAVIDTTTIRDDYQLPLSAGNCTVSHRS